MLMCNMLSTLEFINFLFLWNFPEYHRALYTEQD
jgi:hypothetical protein